MDSPLGIDLAKLVFSIHGVDVNDKCKLRKTVKRNKLLAEVAKLPPYIIAMEACSGAHYWAREFTKLGYDVHIMASKFVIPYRQNEKNDAEAICEEQQAVLCLHRIRQGAIKDRTARINRLRGLLSEFGIIIPKGRYPLQNAMSGILEDAENALPFLARELLNDLWQTLKA